MSPDRDGDRAGDGTALVAGSDDAIVAPGPAPPVDPDRPPPGDVLPPVARGWLVRRVTSLLPWRQVALSRRRAAQAATVAAVGGSVALYPWLLALGLPGYRLPRQAAVLTYMVAFSLVQGLSFVLRTARALAQRRAFARPLTVALRPGCVVKVRGRIEASEPFSAALSGAPVVVARYLDNRRTWPKRDETRAIDFALRPEGSDAQPIRISARDVALVDRPRGKFPYTESHPRGPQRTPLLLSPMMLLPENMAAAVGMTMGAGLGLWIGITANRARARCAEARVGPGDEVEVVGIVDEEVDVAGRPTLGRDLPMRTVIRAAPGMPLLVRLVRRPGEESRFGSRAGEKRGPEG